ncbi:MAG: DnaJ C-terminal domain-containing protein [Chloroflexota bacterium]
MEYKDYYKILGVDKRASEREIKQAYRKLARQYHPDVNPGDKQAEERFKEINEAHKVLSDSEKRQKYDQLGSSYFRWQQQGGDPRGFDWSQWFAQQQAAGGGGTHVEFGDLGGLFGDSGFSDFFERIFGGAAGQRASGQSWARQRGRDYEQPIEVTLEEAAAGTQRVLRADGETITVKIPAGVRSGSRVRVAGKGGAGAGKGPSGDLYLKVSVTDHPVFERQGDDLYCEVPLDVYTAVLGGEVQVPTLDGQVRLKIPAGTQGGRSFRLKAKGMPHLREPSGRGDLYARVRIQVPKGLSKKERALFEELAKLRNP